MRIDIAGRQVEVTPALRRFTADKLKKVEKILDGPIEAHVVLAIEKHRHLAEIQVKGRSALLSGQQETEDLYASIGAVVDKLERQALKHKEKLETRKRRAHREAAAATVAAAPAKGKKVPARRPTSVAATAAGPRIVRTSRYRLKPFSVEDAALELEAAGEEILVYRDSESYRVNVVYRRPDGSFGLVDPEF